LGTRITPIERIIADFLLKIFGSPLSSLKIRLICAIRACLAEDAGSAFIRSEKVNKKLLF
jgi:hypothetical protein